MHFAFEHSVRVIPEGPKTRDAFTAIKEQIARQASSEEPSFDDEKG